MFGSSSPSLADIAAVTRNNDGYNNGAGWGEGWWVLIILFALFGGWGGNWGNNGGRNGNCCDTGSSVTVVEVPSARGGYGMGYGFENAALQRGFDNQTVINKLDGLANGICGLGYDQLAQMNGLGTQIMQGNFGLQQAINDNTVAGMQNTNGLSRQLSECCCDLRAGLKDIQYAMATDTCALKTEVHQTGDAIIQSQNAGFQMLNNVIRDGFCSLEMREMQRENQALRDRLATCDMNNALQGTASYIIGQVRPTPIPSWNVDNPWANCNCNVGCQQNCGRC